MAKVKKARDGNSAKGLLSWTSQIARQERFWVFYLSFLKRAEAAFWPVLSSLGKDKWRRSICESTMWVALAVAKVKTCFFAVAGAGRRVVLPRQK